MDRILFNPEGFFNDILKEKVRLKIPFFVILIYGIFGVASSMLMINKIILSLPPDASQYMFVGVVIGAITGLIGVYLYWLILAGVFYLVASLFNSEGTFRRTFEFVGYGFLPLIFASMIDLGALYTVLPTLDLSLNGNINQIMTNPILQASQVMRILFVIWSAYIWVFAIKNAMNITTRNALIVVGIPAGVYILYSGYNLIINVL